MAIGCGAKCAKFMLIFFNIIFWLSGCAILGIGIWMRVDQTILNNIELLTVNSDDKSLEYASYVLIAMGALVFIVGFLGCCGAIKENKCMLGLYIFFLLLIMAGELAAGILVLLYKDTILKTATNELVEKLNNDTIYDPITSESSDKVKFTPFGLVMSASQVQFKCCGINGSLDYSGTPYEKASGKPFPLSRGVMKEGKETITEDMNLSEAVKDAKKCQEKDEEFYYKQGCKDGIEQFFNANSLVLIGVGIGIACLELFGFIFAICLCRNTGDDDE